MPVTISPPEVDLEPSAVASSDYDVDVDQNANFSATVTNNGSDPAPPFTLAFYYSTNANISVDDTEICEVDGPALQPGQSTSVDDDCFVPPLPSGAYRLGAIVDPGDAIGETDEGNNAALGIGEVAITAPNVDLYCSFHSTDLGFFAQPGEDLQYTVHVWNNGSEASPNFEVTMVWSVDQAITLGDIEGCTRQLAGIPALTQAVFEFDCTVPDFPPGNYYSGTIIDPSNEIPESDESNNIGVSGDPQIFN